jgi:hypothetical protein
MLFAPLTPYVTVGAFIVAMMLTSALLSLVLLPALVVGLRAWLRGMGPEPRILPGPAIDSPRKT